MREEICDIWEKHDAGEWIAITTNPVVTKRGTLVMGRGTALQATQRYPDIAYDLAWHVRLHGNIPAVLPRLKMFTLPVKRHWQETASVLLIIESLEYLADMYRRLTINELIYFPSRIYIPRPGCGNGQLQWNEVRSAIIERELDLGNFIFVSNSEL